MLRIIVNGANGRMGQEVVKAVEQTTDLSLVATTGSQDDLATAIQTTKADIVVDFTRPDCVFQNTKTIIEQGAHPVIGTTGLTQQQIVELQQLAKTKQRGGVIAPNFSIGAILMMQFAEQAAHYLPHVEIIEMHHDKKLDAPSGTALKTAHMIAANRDQLPTMPTCKESIVGARGGNYENIAIHSIRLPGFLAHQMVIFGAEGESLTIKHDTISRSCFMPGVIMACRKVTALHELVYGLEYLMD
ncbi:MAG: 4-hydroxy-tetrahydrodipicolinate reductase [Gammaproteobacteria bacterium]